tara:strand:- start:4228 stop:5760 length:1533 start_codon:yes stop_codon:yes gene_type:complete
MMKHLIQPLFCITAVVLTAIPGRAQNAHSLAFNDFAPQHLEFRIAHQPQHGYFAFPALGNASFALSNSMIHPAQWLSQTGNDPLATIVVDEVFSSWDDPNRLAASVQLDWLQFGRFFNEKSSFVHGGIREFAHFSLTLPTDLLKFPLTGNANFDLMNDAGLDLSDLELHAEHRRSYYLGWQKRWNDRLSSGIRLSFIQGIRNVNATVQNLNWSTDVDTWDWDLTGQASGQSSGMWPVVQLIDSDGLSDADVLRLQEEMIAGLGRGVGMDFGLEYAWSSKWMTFLQVNDLGRIKWEEDVLNYTTQSASFVFTGFSLNEEDNWTIDGAEDSLVVWSESVSDDLENQAEFIENGKAYSTYLGSRWSVGAEYAPFPNAKWSPSLGVLLVKKNQLPISWRVSWNQEWGSGMKTSLTLGERDGLGTSAGVSIAVNAGPLVLSLAADSHRMLNWTEFAMDNTNGDGSDYYFPTYSPTIQLQAGVVFRFGWRSKDERKKSNTKCETFDVPSSTSKPSF